MKASILFPTLLLALFSSQILPAQVRFFQIGIKFEAENWLDSSFVVAAGDPALLAEIELELAKPVEERRHINGPIEAGNGGFNHNANYWFAWHHTPDAWTFADFSIELCDGRAYTDVESDTTYWLRTVGQFCPWSSYIAREVSAPVSVREPGMPLSAFYPIFPNPVDDEMILNWRLHQSAHVVLSITDVLGRMTLNIPMGVQSEGTWNKRVQTTTLNEGVYFVTLKADNQTITQKIMVRH